MTEPQEQTLLEHLEELRTALLKCLIVTALLYPLAYLVTPATITALVKWSCPPELGQLNFFSPMEVFLVRLKLALVLALVVAYPYILWQIWRFLLPALYEEERKALKLWVGGSTFLFALGVFFCLTFILPLVMRFSAGFATAELKPVLGLSSFLHLAGWLMLAFGVMFQFPLAVLLAVRFGLVSINGLKEKRPYIFVLILLVSAFLTPPDVISQLMLTLPTYLLFEGGLYLARYMETSSKTDETEKNESTDTPAFPSETTLEDFYAEEIKRPPSI